MSEKYFTPQFSQLRSHFESFLNKVLVVFSLGRACQDLGHGVVGQSALPLHQEDVARLEEEGGGDRGQAGASYQKYCGLAQADGEQGG